MRRYFRDEARLDVEVVLFQTYEDPVTKISRTPSGGASRAIRRTRSRPSAPRRRRRRTHTAVVALEVAVEVDVQPQAFTERLRAAIVDGRGPVTTHPALPS